MEKENIHDELLNEGYICITDFVSTDMLNQIKPLLDKHNLEIKIINNKNLSIIDRLYIDIREREFTI